MYRLLFAVLLAGAAFGQSGSTEQILQQAIQHHQSGDFADAIREYREYLKVRPEAVNALSNLGAALAHEGQYEEAIKNYEKALREAPAMSSVRLNLALAYYKTGRIGDAARELQRVHGEQPHDRQTTLLLADCWLRMGENAKVAGLLNPLDTTGHDDLAVTYLLGTALVRDKRVDKGQVLIDRILRNGDSAEARLLMGTTKLTAADFAGAREDLKKAVEIDPKLPDVYSYYGLALLRTGDQEGAMTAFRKELEGNPNDFTSNLNLGAMLKDNQKYDEAEGYLKRALLVRPGDPGVEYQLAVLHQAEGKNEVAIGELESLVKQAPNFTEAHVSLAAVYYRVKRKADGDRERAIAKKLTAEAQAKEPGAKLDAAGAKATP